MKDPLLEKLLEKCLNYNTVQSMLKF